MCVWNNTYELDCSNSEDYYEESNRAFSGNSTAESNINDNIKNSTEITDMEIDEVDESESDETRTNVVAEEIKIVEVPKVEVPKKTEFGSEEPEMVEKNSIEEKVENVPETEEFHEFQAELLPSSLLDIDASVAASSSESSSASHPHKISLSILDPIIEMPSEDQLQTSESSRNIRKRSGNHRNRFLFKADAH